MKWSVVAEGFPAKTGWERRLQTGTIKPTDVPDAATRQATYDRAKIIFNPTAYILQTFQSLKGSKSSLSPIIYNKGQKAFQFYVKAG